MQEGLQNIYTFPSVPQAQVSVKDHLPGLHVPAGETAAVIMEGQNSIPKVKVEPVVRPGGREGNYRQKFTVVDRPASRKHSGAEGVRAERIDCQVDIAPLQQPFPGGQAVQIMAVLPAALPLQNGQVPLAQVEPEALLLQPCFI